MENKILEKIKKLLALANSDNENEARLAADMANELLTRHNISIKSVEDFNKEVYIENTLSESGKRSVEDKFICSLLNKFFFVTTLSSRRYGKTTVEILGEQTNVQTATYIHGFLHRSFKSLWEAYKEETGAPTTSKQQYYLGLYYGIHDQLDRKRTVIKQESQSNSTALVVCDKKLNTFVSQKYPRLRTTTWNAGRNYDGDARSRGQRDGENLRINQGIEAGNSKQNYLNG